MNQRYLSLTVLEAGKLRIEAVADSVSGVTADGRGGSRTGTRSTIPKAVGDTAAYGDIRGQGCGLGGRASASSCPGICRASVVLPISKCSSLLVYSHRTFRNSQRGSARPISSGPRTSPARGDRTGRNHLTLEIRDLAPKCLWDLPRAAGALEVGAAPPPVSSGSTGIPVPSRASPPTKTAFSRPSEKTSLFLFPLPP